MGETMNCFMGMFEQVADVTTAATKKVVEKSKEKVDKITLQKRIAKAEQQLGKLTYVLNKTGEENPELVEIYVKEIDALKQTLEDLEPTKEPTKTSVYSFQGTEENEDAMFCGGGKQEFPTE